MALLKFIHSADLHLDSPFKGKNQLPDKLKEKLRTSTFKAYERLIQQAIHHQVDFVLLVGDLFNEEVRSLKAQVKLREGFDRLKQYGIQVYISYGNHDYIMGAHYPIAYPENVHIFEEEEVKVLPFYKDHTLLANIYGFSYEQRAVTKKMTPFYMKEGDAAFHIGMLHGSLETQTEHDVYAPFSMQDLYRTSIDYWALGHIHKRQILSDDPPVIYPGNIQGRSHKESGEKGCYLVEWKGEAFSYQFLPLHSFTYEQVTVECDSITHAQQLEEALERAKAMLTSDDAVMLKVMIKSSHGMLKKWKAAGLVDEWRELVNDRETLDGPWVWIDQVQIEDVSTWNEEELRNSSHFAGEFLRNLDEMTEDEFYDFIGPLFSHRRASKWLDQLTDTDKRELKEAAKEMVLQQIVTGEEE
ncbi:DNA repair exonuclease [Halobacillus andaensis]|uniref:DNA repair exonuclease n=1 Tax=Halobacillus andaensis TaxID=1176239 RepID=A0A917B166_HALAA|nr:DNA repair exonuclease [Halobacillus andaensis]MBP2004139.1 DNA repair exonuclease SbcCD nuclease subunit [Halobacillus andaensis]GGF16101.1 DNA repair exonuclease [Halobacillus andaensis]